MPKLPPYFYTLSCWDKDPTFIDDNILLAQFEAAAMTGLISVQYHPNSLLPLLKLNNGFTKTNKTSLTIRRPIAILVDRSSSAKKLQVPYKLKEGQSRIFHQLPSGFNMEVIFQKGIDNSKHKLKYPPLVFIHGSFHAAWCWAVHWLPFFSQFGYDCYAVSLLAQGESDEPLGPAAGTIQTHASDVANFIEKEINLPPVLLGHSFGGLIVQSYISNMKRQDFSGIENPHPKLAGAVLLCSVPPSGNSGVVLRYIFSKPVAAFKVTLSLAAKAFATSISLCKETFFSKEMEDDLVQSYQELMKKSSRMPLFDLKKLNASLPVSQVPRSSIEVLVLGASDDFIVDEEGVRETAMFYGVEPIRVDGVAHDMMLDCSWDKGAQMILSWLNDLHKQDPQF